MVNLDHVNFAGCNVLQLHGYLGGAQCAKNNSNVHKFQSVTLELATLGDLKLVEKPKVTLARKSRS